MDAASLLAQGYARECPNCGEVSAYSWDDADEDYEPYGGIQPGKVGHIPCASGYEWECGHCRAHLVHRDAPILAACYTHAED
jgi:hypothetical protein